MDPDFHRLESEVPRACIRCGHLPEQHRTPGLTTPSALPVRGLVIVGCRTAVSSSRYLTLGEEQDD
jgi:hypothetical protein